MRTHRAGSNLSYAGSQTGAVLGECERDAPVARAGSIAGIRRLVIYVIWAWPNPAVPIESGDRDHLLCGELEVKDLEVLAHPLGVR